MESERWKRAEWVFGQALDYPADQRATFLEGTCSGDSELRREVESLLRAHDKADTFLDRPAWDGCGTSQKAPEIFEAPRSVGPYRLVRKIGEGGMSVVYLAVRADKQFRRRVAVKFLRQSRQTEELERRFASERQILAAMDHPNVAELHDAGTTSEGLPYFVMEYIDGEPLDEYCDRHRLTLGERLELFRDVCSAVHYAHQNLVVHRDLKPSNILVTEEGTPKLLDFGIAKLLKPELSGQALEPTVTWLQVMTPDYASPEQVQDKPITTASDVYSLGVILYRLLTGRLPHRFAGRSPREIERVLSQEPEKPSTAIDQMEERSGSTTVSQARGVGLPELRRQLVGDLDNIVAMALRKEPQRRYSSAEQLSEDIRRHLAGLPVVARRDTLGYRLEKFLRRNLAAVATAVAFFVLISSSAVGLGILSTRLAKQRDQAQRERDKSMQVAGFLEDIFEVSDPNQAKGEVITAREILDRSAQRIARELEAQPQVRASFMRTIGNVYRKLGLYEQAEPLLRSALETRRGLLGEGHPEVAESLHDLGDLREARGDYEGSEQYYRRALELRRRHFGENRLEVAESLSALGLALLHRGLERDAENLYRQALETRQRILGDNHPDVAQSLNRLGEVLGDQGDYTTAEALHRQALEIRREHFGENHLAVSSSLNNLAMVLKDKGDLEEAERLLRESLEIHRKLLGEDHQAIAVGLNNLASLAARRGDYQAAADFYSEALDLARRILGDGHPKIAFALVGVGMCKCRLDDPKSGEPFLRLAIEIRRRSLPAGHRLTAWTESLLGECLTRMGRYQEAEPMLVDSYRAIAAQRPAEDRETMAALERVVDLYDAWGKPDMTAEFRAAAGAARGLVQ